VWYEHRPFVEAIEENPLTNERGSCWWGLWGTMTSKLSSPLAPPPSSCPSQSSWVASKQVKMTTSSSHLDAREVVVVADGRNDKKNYLQLAFEREGGGVVAGSRNSQRNHLQLAFGCEGGGSGGRRSKQLKEPPPARVWTRGRWWQWEMGQKNKRNHLRLAFGCEGGGGGRRVKRTKKSTSGSRLDAREVAVVGGGLEEWKWPPPARVK